MLEGYNKIAIVSYKNEDYRLALYDADYEKLMLGDVDNGEIEELNITIKTIKHPYVIIKNPECKNELVVARITSIIDVDKYAGPKIEDEVLSVVDLSIYQKRFTQRCKKIANDARREEIRSILKKKVQEKREKDSLIEDAKRYKDDPVISKLLDEYLSL